MRRRTMSVCVCVSVSGFLVAAATLGGCASDTSSRASHTNHNRTYRLASGDAVGMQILQHNPSYSASDETSSFATAESAELSGK
ncbi:MAG: hypothetical protein H7210_05380 [Pyrinomonadaceae bacterium]|nr:hypothetical protein [Phycisphaerales bacterium]